MKAHLAAWVTNCCARVNDLRPRVMDLVGVICPILLTSFIIIAVAAIPAYAFVDANTSPISGNVTSAPPSASDYGPIADNTNLTMTNASHYGDGVTIAILRRGLPPSAELDHLCKSDAFVDAASVFLITLATPVLAIVVERAIKVLRLPVDVCGRVANVLLVSLRKLESGIRANGLVVGLEDWLHLEASVRRLQVRMAIRLQCAVRRWLVQRKLAQRVRAFTLTPDEES